MRPRIGDILLATCKDPNHTILAIESPSWFNVRPLIREPRVVTYIVDVDGLLRVASLGIVSLMRKPLVTLARATSDGWGGWSREYMVLKNDDPRATQIIDRFMLWVDQGGTE